MGSLTRPGLNWTTTDRMASRGLAVKRFVGSSPIAFTKKELVLLLNLLRHVALHDWLKKGPTRGLFLSVGGFNLVRHLEGLSRNHKEV